MMKKIITVIATAFMAISASAQSEVGSLSWQPNMGITYTTATSDLGEWADGAVALTAGVEAMYMLKDMFEIALEPKDYKDYYKSTFFSVPVGASYEYKHFVFDARYNIGLSKVADVCKGTYNVFTFTVGYKF